MFSRELTAGNYFVENKRGKAKVGRGLAGLVQICQLDVGSPSLPLGASHGHLMIHHPYLGCRIRPGPLDLADTAVNLET